jgi:hypothetical protein
MSSPLPAQYSDCELNAWGSVPGRGKKFFPQQRVDWFWRAPSLLSSGAGRGTVVPTLRVREAIPVLEGVMPRENFFCMQA